MFQLGSEANRSLYLSQGVEVRTRGSGAEFRGLLRRLSGSGRCRRLPRESGSSASTIIAQYNTIHNYFYFTLLTHHQLCSSIPLLLPLFWPFKSPINSPSTSIDSPSKTPSSPIRLQLSRHHIPHPPSWAALRMAPPMASMALNPQSLPSSSHPSRSVKVTPIRLRPSAQPRFSLEKC